MTNLERFKDKIVENFEGCWVWLGQVNHAGYGLCWAGDNLHAAHRWGYIALQGSVPEGLQLDHLCRRRDCVNPSHLEPVTGKENKQRAMKDTCRNGHGYTESNTYIDRKGRRDCRVCRKQAVRQWRAKLAGNR